jgi:hypothetical protein
VDRGPPFFILIISSWLRFTSGRRALQSPGMLQNTAGVMAGFVLMALYSDLTPQNEAK